MADAQERRGGLTSEEFNQIAWRDFLLWASNEQGFIDAFNAATGRHYRARDVRPTDAELAADTEAFVRWVTVHHWGVEYAPEKYRNELAAAASLPESPI
jgi:hypothetical protein